MNYAARINSFMHKYQKSVQLVFDELANIEGITSVDLNYPEHFAGNNIQEIKNGLEKNGLTLNGIAVRFRDDFINGELGNADPVIAAKALQLCYESIDACRALGGEVVTVWLGFDGYDYCFQVDYAKTWQQVVDAFQKICDYGHDLKISIEYKPFQPRVHSLISSIGDTLAMIREINRPNIGGTLDFCHMLMKAENPAFGLSMLAARNKLFGVHLNDGNHLNDDGLMTGMMNLNQTIEFIYYLKKSGYEGAVYFDTFPVREDPSGELRANISMFDIISRMVDRVGQEKIQKVIDSNNALEAQKLMLDFLGGQ